MTLLIDAFTAYLGPLLKKHDAGETLVWEDLESSHTASKEVLQSSDNIFVSGPGKRKYRRKFPNFRGNLPTADTLILGNCVEFHSSLMIQMVRLLLCEYTISGNT